MPWNQPTPTQDWLWAALAGGELELVTNADLRGVDWGRSDRTHHKYLGTIIIGSKESPTTEDEYTNRLELLRFAIAQAAQQPLPNNFNVLLSMTRDIIVTELVGMKAECRRNDGVRSFVSYLREAARIMTPPPPGGVTASSQVSNGVIETWEAVLADKESADVTIVCHGHVAGSGEMVSHSGGAAVSGANAAETAETSELQAHSIILRAASKVLSAMLSTSSFREGASKRLDVDVGADAVGLLLELVYTGGTSTVLGESAATGASHASSRVKAPARRTSSSRSKGRGKTGDDDAYAGCPGVEIQAAALELAHRWQIDHVVGMLVQSLARDITPDSFTRVCEPAVRLQIANLLEACRSCAVKEPSIKLRFESGDVYPVTVQAWLENVFGPAGTPARKRLRRCW